MSAMARIVGLVAVPLLVVTTTQAFAGQNWDIDVHGGVLMSTNPTGGTSALPPAGADIPVNGPLPTTTTRRVSSWYFGDGAEILNQILVPRTSIRIVPLDSVLQSRISERQSGGSFGFRVDRSLTPRFGAEFALDEARGQLTLRPTATDLITESQASFLTTWNALLNAPSAGGQVVSSDATVDDKRGRQLVTSGALLINLLSSPALTPYVAIGAGYIAARNGAPSVTLVGNYDFTFPPAPVPVGQQFHINETDMVKIQSVAENSVTWVFGGGVKYAVGNRWGVRADRHHVNRDVIRTNLTTAPKAAVVGPPIAANFAFAQNSPIIIFSSTPLSLSTLSTVITDFRTFSGTGIVNQVNASAGVFWRF